MRYSAINSSGKFRVHDATGIRESDEMPPDQTPDMTAPSEKSRRIGKALIGIALAVLFLLTVGGLFIGWLIYSSKKPNPDTVVASFRSDFQESQPKPGWRYLWNP